MRYLNVLQQVLEVLALQAIEVGVRLVHLQRVYALLRAHVPRQKVDGLGCKTRGMLY